MCLGEPSRHREYRQMNVILVDMFQSFLKHEPLRNPHYEAIKAESDDWISRQVGS